MSDIHEAFKTGARLLVVSNAGKYGDMHRAHGITPEEWKLLTQVEYWTPDQARSIRSVLANIIEVCLTISGMPAIALPGQYAAAVIASVVSPANRMVACMKVPDTFDAWSASGILGPVEIRPMSAEQLLSLVILYSADFPGEPQIRLPREVGEVKKKELSK